MRRSGVTAALGELQRVGLVRAGRSVIKIIDQKGLEVISNGAYGTPDADIRVRFK